MYSFVDIDIYDDVRYLSEQETPAVPRAPPRLAPSEAARCAPYCIKSSVIRTFLFFHTVVKVP